MLHPGGAYTRTFRPLLPMGFLLLTPADFSGHSFRSGFLTSTASRGASVFKLIEISRHKSVDTLRGYIRRVEIFEGHAAEGLL